MPLILKLFMHDNAVSYRTKQQNLLRSKTQSFLHNYAESRQRVQSRSSAHKLAGTVYSSRQNREMSPQVRASQSVVFPLIKFENPEVTASSAMKGLNMRASHIGNYSDINTELILERRALEQKIAFLRDEIAREKKLLARADMAAKRANNDLERANNSIREMNIKSDRLNDAISEARQDCNDLRMALNGLKNENVLASNSIASEQANCANLECRCKLLKNGVLADEKARGILKGELIRDQKVMTSCSVLTKELEHERAVLMLEINRSVALNRLP